MRHWIKNIIPSWRPFNAIIANKWNRVRIFNCHLFINFPRHFHWLCLVHVTIVSLWVIEWSRDHSRLDQSIANVLLLIGRRLARVVVDCNVDMIKHEKCICIFVGRRHDTGVLLNAGFSRVTAHWEAGWAVLNFKEWLKTVEIDFFRIDTLVLPCSPFLSVVVKS